MRKILAAAAFIGLFLAACTSNTGSSVGTLPEMSGAPSQEVLGATPSGSGVAMSCSDAFSSISASDLASITSLASAQALLDATIQACPTVNDWTNAAKTVMPSVDLSQAADFLKQRCQANTQLQGTQLCMTVAS